MGFLVLSRQRDEDVILDFSGASAGQLEQLRARPIVLRTMDIRGDKVRQGIDAPEYVAVHRREVHDAIQREHRAAQQVKPESPSELAKSQLHTGSAMDPALHARDGYVERPKSRRKR